jgi:cyclopropane-fatty-acyl-phospholipid synthase
VLGYESTFFPGGYVPALSQVMPAIERSGLWLTDLEILRLHYAETLRHWRDRFLGHGDGPADERFRRMWEYYLTVSEMSFRFGGFMVFRAQLARQVDAVPMTRDYMFEQEQIGQPMVAV